MSNILTSVLIPSRKERFLNETIRDVLKNAVGEIEVLPILDGYEPDELVKDPRVKYIRLSEQKRMQKRHGVNAAVAFSSGKYVMALDAHCMVAKGFNKVLERDHQDNWIQIPRRHRLDAENWCLQDQSDGRPPIDYEYIMWFRQDGGIHGYKWDTRTHERKHIMIDDTLTFQGSAWFMTKDWFNKMGFMQIEGYGGWGQEAESLSFKTWQNGGKVKTNKNTWYAHLHKGKKYGRMYFMSKDANRKCYAYSRKRWLVDNKKFFISLIKKFAPLPGWPEDWERQIREEKIIYK